MAADDVCRPEFIRRCVEVLDENPDVALAYPRTVDIDARGGRIKVRDVGLGLDHPLPYERFRRLIAQGHGASMLYGVHRTDILAQTHLQGSFYGSDRPLLGEIALRGLLVEVPEELFMRRQHEGRSVHQHKRSYGMQEWFGTRNGLLVTMPTWHRFAAYVRSIRRAPLPQRDRLHLYGLMVRWFYGMRAQLWTDLRRTVASAAGARSALGGSRS
jgi:hypothetical protein